MSPIDDIPSADTAADRSLIAKEKEDEVLRVFREDVNATRVLQGLLVGMKKNEIIQKRGISNKEYQPAMKRIRMKLLIGKNGSRGGRGISNKEYQPAMKRIRMKLLIGKNGSRGGR